MKKIAFQSFSVKPASLHPNHPVLVYHPSAESKGLAVGLGYKLAWNSSQLFSKIGPGHTLASLRGSHCHQPLPLSKYQLQNNFFVCLFDCF